MSSLTESGRSTWRMGFRFNGSLRPKAGLGLSGMAYLDKQRGGRKSCAKIKQRSSFTTASQGTKGPVAVQDRFCLKPVHAATTSALLPACPCATNTRVPRSCSAPDDLTAG
jgi:hypothetical protein